MFCNFVGGETIHHRCLVDIIILLLLFIAQPTSRLQGPKVNTPLPVSLPPMQTLPKQLDQSQWSQPQGSSSLEYITLREMLADLVDSLAGNAPVITQLNNHLFSSSLIAKAVHIDAQNTVLSPYDRASKMINAVLATLECHPTPNSVFTSLITTLSKVGLTVMANKLMESFSKCIHHQITLLFYLIGEKGGHIDIILEQIQTINDQPHQLADTATAAQPPTLSQTQSLSPTSPTVIELSSKSEVASNIKNLHSRFLSFDFKLRDEFEELVEKGRVKLKHIARSAASYLEIPVSSLKFTDVDELFDSLKLYYNFFNCGLLRHVTETYLSTVLMSELTQYTDDVDKFSESSQLKHIRSTIKRELSHLHIPASQSNQTKPAAVVIQLNDRWEEMTMSRLKAVLKHYFGKESDLFRHIDFDYGSFIIKLLTPTTQTYLIDTINEKASSMNRLGIMEVAVDNNTIRIRKGDDDNFNAWLHQSVKAGDSFEVDMLLQLGADPNNKDETGKYPVETAIEGGHAMVLQTLLTGGANESKLNFE